MDDRIPELLRMLPEKPLSYDTRLADVLPADWAGPLVEIGMETAEDLYELAAHNGAKWYRQVPGLDPLRAAALMAWFEKWGKDVGEVTERFFLPEHRPEHMRGADDEIDPRLRPLEEIVPPPELDGRGGVNRTFHEGCALEADDDGGAIRAWLLARAANPNTEQAYRKEAERFWLWCLYERNVALSSVKAGDAARYLRWLEGLGRTDAKKWARDWTIPQKSWIGPKNRPRSSPDWHPFNGPLSVSSRHSAIVAVRQLFNFLRKTGYLQFNPFDQISPKVPLLPGEGAPQEFADRSLTPEQWRWISMAIDELPEGWRKERLRLILMLGKSLGLRASEIAAARAGWITSRRIGLKVRRAIEVVGKGAKVRRLPINDEQLDILNRAMLSRGLPEVDQCPPETPLLVNLNRGPKPGAAMSRSGIYRVLERFLYRVADDIAKTRPLDAAKLRAASTHWLRHTFAVTALTKMSVNVVQAAMGHASVATTGRYLNPEEEAMSEAMEKMKTFG